MIYGYLADGDYFYADDAESSDPGVMVKYLQLEDKPKTVPCRAVIEENMVVGYHVLQNRKEQLESIGHFFFVTLRKVFRERTGDDEAFLHSFIVPNYSEYADIACRGLHNDKMVATSVDMPRQLLSGMEEQLIIANVVRDKIVQLAQERFTGAV